jgi:NAD(P)-dependent dehydrogenase (short-subunit alcohol dehydrogenase family)
LSGGLAGKAGIVTGGGGTLGRAVAHNLASQGASVLVVDIDGAAAEETAASADVGWSGAIEVMVGDLAVEQTIIDAVATVEQRWGRLDFLHNNAGIELINTLSATTNEQWEATDAVNVKATFWGCKHAVNSMKKDGRGGSIINMGSVVSVTAEETLGAYSASKHAVLGITRSVAVTREAAAAGIRCNCVCPGSADTPLLEHLLADAPDPAQARLDLEAKYPASRLVTAEEIADVVCFFVSDASRAVSGTYLPVDGGFLAKLY